MNPNVYQDATEQTQIYAAAAEEFIDDIEVDSTRATEMLSVMYCAGKLNGEAGEVAEIVFKAFRAGELSNEDKSKLFYELGDVLWYVARLSDLCGHRLADVMLANIEKLQDRKRRGVIQGSGDDR